MIVTLIGYRGSGKSTVAPILAERLGLKRVDADDEIERQAGCSISEIFRNESEAGFRVWERKIIIELLSRDNVVIAAGGGAILDADTRRDMREVGPVVWLRASAEELDRRIHGDASSADRRPDLTASGGRKEIEDLLKIRNPLYTETATIVIDTAARTPAEIVDDILPAIADSGANLS